MKILTAIYFLTYLTSFGQSEQKPSDNSYVFKKFSIDYDSIIAYSKNCYWPDKRRYTILGLRNEKWELLTVDVFFKSHDNKTVKRTKVKKAIADKEQIKSLKEVWTNNRIWTIQNDSINKNWKIVGNRTMKQSISDGCSDNFEIFDRKNYKQLDAYEADRLQLKFYTDDRERFIICRNYFIDKFVK